MDFTILHFAIHIVWRANVICTCRKSGIARKTTVAYPELRLVYYNVSVILPDNLSEMNIAYNSEYQMTFNEISSCDLHQLSEFILALERDIPKWKHIWVADDKLKKEQSKIVERVKSAMLQFRSDWMSVGAKDDEKMIEKFRIKYYNLKACKMFLENDNPFWENKTTEVEILDECRTLHIDPPHGTVLHRVQ